MKYQLTSLHRGCVVLGSLLGVAACHAGFTFDVTTDTSSLVGSLSSPFSLDFQLTDGSGTSDGNNTVTLSNFHVTGGVWTGPASVSLTDNQFFTESVLPFTPGTSVSFRVSMSTLVDPGGIPDQFSFGIVDKNSVPLHTTGVADELLSVNIDSAVPNIDTFGTDPLSGFNIGAPGVTVVPEPASVGMVFASLCGIAALIRARSARDRFTASNLPNA